MTQIHPEQGPLRGPDDVTSLTADMIMPLSVQELTDKYPSGRLRELALGQSAISAGYARLAEDLREQAQIFQAHAEDARGRADVYLEAASIVDGEQSGN